MATKRATILIFTLMTISSCVKMNGELVKLKSNLGPFNQNPNQVPTNPPPPSNALCATINSGNALTLSPPDQNKDEILLTGIFTRTIRDYFDHKQESTIHNTLELDSGEVFELDLSELDKDSEIMSGDKIQILGQILPPSPLQKNSDLKILKIKEASTIATNSQNQSQKFKINNSTITEYKILAVPVTFNNLNTLQNLPLASIEEYLNNMKNYYDTVTDHHVQLVLDLDNNGHPDSYPVTLNADFKPNSNNYNSPQCNNPYYKANAEILIPPAIREKYTHFMFFIDQPQAMYNSGQYLCGYSIAELPGLRTLITFAKTSHDFVMIHELGHNFNLLHAQADFNGDKQASGQGEEYGNRADIMGHADVQVAPYAVSAMVLGVFQNHEDLISTITSGGTYSISPMGAGFNVPHPKVIRIPGGSGGQSIMIEYRNKNFGLDANIPDPTAAYPGPYTGVMIYVVNSENQQANVYQQGLLLKTLTAAGQTYTASMQGGKQFVIKLESISNDRADINVALSFTPSNQCLHANLNVRATNIAVVDDKNIEITFRAKNFDSFGCPPNTYTAKIDSTNLKENAIVTTSIVAEGTENPTISAKYLTGVFTEGQILNFNISVTSNNGGTVNQPVKATIHKCN